MSAVVSTASISRADFSAAKPPFKYAGGKTQLLPELLRHVPEDFGVYHEPFLGGGALFWNLAASDRLRNGAVISDMNDLLVRTYSVIRDECEALIARLSLLANDRGVFEAMRQRDPSEMSDLERAEWFLYLNKTAYNGLFRVNKKGRYNVPFGEYARPKICDKVTLEACSKVLNFRSADGSRAIRLLRQPFEDVLAVVKAGDLVYLDPPYPPLSKTSNFVSYTDQGFTWADQERVRDVALELKKRGATVIVSNSDQLRVRELYADPLFEVRTVLAKRAINSKGDGRGAVAELVIT